MDEQCAVHDWSPEQEEKALQFLKSRFATSMFLLGNLADQGPTLNSQPNSGNFKVIRKGPKVVGVFSLTRRGNLILNTEAGDSVSELILSQCLKEPIELKGVIGEWNCASSFWNYIQHKKVLSTCSFNSKELLFQLDQIPNCGANAQVRLLEDVDFDQWLPIRKAYTMEEGLKVDLTDEQLRTTFLRYSKLKEFWGYFEGEMLVATAALNAKAMDIGQVGGVYTKPEFRRRGISKLIMRQMLSDCVRIHGIKKMILFTGEKNFAAQKVYLSLGFKQVGHFGIIFS
jgi:predicted GNAT family acetyltransferase